MANEPNCTVTYPDGERCDRLVKSGGLCTGHIERRRLKGDPLLGGKLRTRRKPGTPCSIGRVEPWLDQPECPGNHYSLGFCAKHYQRHTAHGNPLTTLTLCDHDGRCHFPGCDQAKPYAGLGLCERHYGRAWLHGGDPFGGTRINSLDERLLRRIIEGPVPARYYNHATDHYDGTPPCPCRDWTGTVNRPDARHKYGVISDKGRVKQVHRVTFEATFGLIPDDLALDHLCCRTICCEPRHLEPVTDAENTRRRWIVINEIMDLYEDEYLAGLAARHHGLVWPAGNVLQPPA